MKTILTPCRLQACWLLYYWPAHRAGLLRCNFFGQPGSVSKFPPFLWVKLWVGWVGRGYIEISRYFPALWINRVTFVTKIKLWYSLGYKITFESPKCLYGMLFCVSKPDSIFSVYHSSPSSHVRSLTCAPRRSIVLQFFWHVDTRPISPFLFFFNSTFYLCIIIVIFYLMYLIH